MLNPKRKKAKRKPSPRVSRLKLTMEDFFFTAAIYPYFEQSVERNPCKEIPISTYEPCGFTPSKEVSEDEARRQRHKDRVARFAETYGNRYFQSNRRSARIYTEAEIDNSFTDIFRGLSIETAGLLTSLGCKPQRQITKEEQDILELEAMFGLPDPR